MKISQRIGRWEFEAFTDGSPAWVRLIEHTEQRDRDGNPYDHTTEHLHGIHPDELAELIFGLQRMQEKIKRK